MPLKWRTGHWPLNSKRKRNNQTAKYGPCRQRSRKDKMVMNTERQKREAFDRKQSIVRESCRKLLAFAEDAIRAIEAETLEVLHSGLEVSLIDEEMSKLKYRNGVLSVKLPNCVKSSRLWRRNSHAAPIDQSPPDSARG